MALTENYLNKYILLTEFNVRNVHNGSFQTNENDDQIPVDDDLIDEDGEKDSGNLDKNFDQPKTDTPPVNSQPDAPKETTPAPAEPKQEPVVDTKPVEPVTPPVEPISNNNDIEKEALKLQIQAMTTILSSVDKLSIAIDNISNKLDTVSAEYIELKNDVQQVKEPSDKEKLEMRSLDSFPYNQKLSDVWRDDPQDELNLRGVEKQPDGSLVADVSSLPKYSNRDLENTLKDF